MAHMKTQEHSCPSDEEYGLNVANDLEKIKLLRAVIAKDGWEHGVAANVLEELLSHRQSSIVVQSIQMLSEVIPNLQKTEVSKDSIVVKLIHFLGSDDFRIKVAASCCLYIYFKSSNNPMKFLRMLTSEGLKNSLESINSGCLLFLNICLPLINQSNLKKLLRAILKNFNSKSRTSFYYTIFTLYNIHNYMGAIFLEQLHATCPDVHHLYLESIKKYIIPKSSLEGDMSRVIRTVSNMASLNIPLEVIDSDEIKRCMAVKKIRSHFRNPSWCLIMDNRIELNIIFSFLQKLFCDPSTKIKIIILDILNDIMERISFDLALHISCIVKILMKGLDSPYHSVIKTSEQVILYRTTKFIHPMAVIEEMLNDLERSSKQAAIVINIINQIFIEFPSCYFKEYAIYEKIRPLLVSFIPSVRHAASESFIILICINIKSDSNAEDDVRKLVKKYDIPSHIATRIIREVKTQGPWYFSPTKRSVFSKFSRHFYKAEDQSGTDDSALESLSSLAISETNSTWALDRKQ